MFIPDTSDLDLVWVLLLCAAEEEGGAGGGARSPSTDTWIPSGYTIFSKQQLETKATVNSIQRIFMKAAQKVFGENFTRQRQSKSSPAK